MSTYADYFNEHYSGSMSSGPVRMTISRNEVSTDDMDMGQMDTESCLVEELMDQEDEFQPHPPAPTSPAAICTPFLSWIQTSSVVWVLDTYVRRL